MTRHRLIRAAAMAGLLALSAAAASENGSGDTTASGRLDARGAASPVLRNAEPTDTRIVRLPGPPRVEAAPTAPAPAPIQEAAPPLPAPRLPKPPSSAAMTASARSAPAAIPKAAPAPASVAIATPAPASIRETAPPPPAPRFPKPPSSAAMTASARSAPAAIPKAAPADPHPAARRRSPLPPDFERDSAEFCRQRIAIWTEADARALLGEPRRSRPAFGPDNAEDGRILAFADPSGRHHQLELDFDRGSGRLRTVFVYPWDMTWEECQRLWGSQVIPAKSNKGRTFYSYADRRLDVLVDGEGKVVSLGLY